MIIILGTPGAGKTTQTKMLAERLGCRWFSMGELIRHNTTGQDRRDMLAGKIINDETTMKLVEQALAPIDTKAEEVVFEGNPRSLPQARWWLKEVAEKKFTIRALIHLIADPKIAEQRMVERGRLDDHDENVIETRFEEYRRSISPTLEFLKANGVPVYEVNANGTIEEIADDIARTVGAK